MNWRDTHLKTLGLRATLRGCHANFLVRAKSPLPRPAQAKKPQPQTNRQPNRACWFARCCADGLWRIFAGPGVSRDEQLALRTQNQLFQTGHCVQHVPR